MTCPHTCPCTSDDECVHDCTCTDEPEHCDGCPFTGCFDCPYGGDVA